MGLTGESWFPERISTSTDATQESREGVSWLCLRRLLRPGVQKPDAYLQRLDRFSTHALTVPGRRVVAQFPGNVPHLAVKHDLASAMGEQVRDLHDSPPFDSAFFLGARGPRLSSDGSFTVNLDSMEEAGGAQTGRPCPRLTMISDQPCRASSRSARADCAVAPVPMHPGTFGTFAIHLSSTHCTTANFIAIFTHAAGSSADTGFTREAITDRAWAFTSGIACCFCLPRTEAIRHLPLQNRASRRFDWNRVLHTSHFFSMVVSCNRSSLMGKNYLLQSGHEERSKTKGGAFSGCHCYLCRAFCEDRAGSRRDQAQAVLCAS